MARCGKIAFAQFNYISFRFHFVQMQSCEGHIPLDPLNVPDGTTQTRTNWYVQVSVRKDIKNLMILNKFYRSLALDAFMLRAGISRSAFIPKLITT